MSLEALLIWFCIWIFLLGVGMVALIVVFCVHFFVPKQLLKAYFKPPYFSPTEIEFFTGFPFAYMRTIMFMRLAGFPKSGKRRGVGGADKMAPRWFLITSKIIISVLLGSCIPMFILGGILFPTMYILYGRG
jgi:hypothetical protein